MRLIHSVNVIQPIGVGQQKHDVKLCLVVAESADEAMRLVAAEQTNDCLLSHRNVHDDPNTVLTWGHQRWSKHDVMQAIRRGQCREPGQLAPFKFTETHSDFNADGSIA